MYISRLTSVFLGHLVEVSVPECLFNGTQAVITTVVVIVSMGSLGEFVEYNDDEFCVMWQSPQSHFLVNEKTRPTIILMITVSINHSVLCLFV